MGTLFGHAANGVFFSAFALIWMMHHAYTISTRGSITHHVTKWSSRGPLAGAVILLLISIAVIIGENSHPFVKWRIVDDSGEWTRYGPIWQHCTIAIFLCLYAIVNISKHTCIPSAARFEVLFGALAFGIELLIFVCHITLPDYLPPLEYLTHALLLIPILTCFLATVGEAFTSGGNLRKLSYIRVVSLLHQGTWLLQIGYIRFIGKWQNGSDVRLYISVFFAWHILFDVIIMIIVYNVSAWFGRRCLSSPSTANTVGTSSEKKLNGNIELDNVEETRNLLA